MAWGEAEIHPVNYTWEDGNDTVGSGLQRVVGETCGEVDATSPNDNDHDRHDRAQQCLSHGDRTHEIGRSEGCRACILKRAKNCWRFGLRFNQNYYPQANTSSYLGALSPNREWPEEINEQQDMSVTARAERERSVEARLKTCSTDIQLIFTQATRCSAPVPPLLSSSTDLEANSYAKHDISG